MKLGQATAEVRSRYGSNRTQYYLLHTQLHNSFNTAVYINSETDVALQPRLPPARGVRQSQGPGREPDTESKRPTS
jgi:hypothetical protein